MKKRFKRLLNKKGLTLVEILVVLIVSSILIGIAMGMLRPVRGLMNAIKGNAHMDALCDTVNEYIRGSLAKAEAVNILIYPDVKSNWTDNYEYNLNAQESVKQAWVDFSQKYKASDGYQLRAIGVMQNYNDDYRLFDFGDVTSINYQWGGSLAAPITLNSSAETEADAGNTFWQLLNFRDGGGRDRTWESPPRSGLDGNEFGKFSAFNDDFYSNGLSGTANYSLQVAFEAVGSDLDDGGSNVNYLSVSTQMFKRIGDKYSSDEDEKNLTYEPANQVRSMSFKMLGGNTSLSTVSGTINKVETVNGGKQIVAGDNGFNNNVVILYVVRDFGTILAP